MARPVKLPRRFDAVLTGQRPATEILEVDRSSLGRVSLLPCLEYLTFTSRLLSVGGYFAELLVLSLSLFLFALRFPQ